MIGANELKRKALIEVDGQPFRVLEVFFSSPTARGASTMVRAKVRNLLNGAVLEKNFKSGEKFNEPDVEMITAAFLYADAEGFHFMDESCFDQFHFSAEKIGDMKFYLKDGAASQGLKYKGTVVSLELPPVVELAVTYAEPATRADSSSGGSTKNATLETGMNVRVPLYIKEGDVLRVNTETGEVSGRA